MMSPRRILVGIGPLLPASGAKGHTGLSPVDLSSERWPSRSMRFNDHERYCPVKTADGRDQTTDQEYKALASERPDMECIGRCGTDEDLDMDKVINPSVAGAEKWLNRALVAFGDPVF